jgi:hypothetical protein
MPVYDQLIEQVIKLDPFKVTDNDDIIISNSLTVTNITSTNINCNDIIISNSLSTDDINCTNIITDNLDIKILSINNNNLTFNNDDLLYLNNTPIYDQLGEQLIKLDPLKVTDNDDIIISSSLLATNISCNEIAINYAEINKLSISNNLLNTNDDDLLYLNNTPIYDQLGEQLIKLDPLKVTDNDDIIISSSLTANNINGNNSYFDNNLLLLDDTIQNINSTVNIQDLNLISVIKFNYDNDDRFKYGFNLDNIKDYYPELVFNNNNTTYINYSQIIPLLVKYIQDLETRVTNLENI